MQRISEVGLAPSEDLKQIAQWLEDPAIWADAFGLPTRPDLAWIEDSTIMVTRRRRIEMVPVRFWSVREVADGSFLGFAIDYEWDVGEESIREIDVVLPGSSRRRLRLPLEVFASVIHQLFSHHAATACRARVPFRGYGRLRDQLFSQIGTERDKISVSVHPVTQQEIAEVHYLCTPQTFYASPWGKRMLENTG